MIKRISAFRVFQISIMIALSFFISPMTLSHEINLSISKKTLADAELKYGIESKKRLIDWQNIFLDKISHTDKEKLIQVNDFFNKIPFVSDKDHWGKEDYWATPAEMIASNGGDCEDFTIAKYFTLASMGIPVDKMRITYVRAHNYNPISQSHMVLTYYTSPDATPLVLDNLIPEIKSASDRSDLTPVYSFNGKGLWISGGNGKKDISHGGADNIHLWHDLLQRIGKEFN
jgi:predicted transglutaminase-like cysteine proteinase